MGSPSGMTLASLPPREASRQPAKVPPLRLLRQRRKVDASSRQGLALGSRELFDSGEGRSTMPSHSALGTAAPSAVPWISTMPPAAVATRFRSTRAVLSSA